MTLMKIAVGSMNSVKYEAVRAVIGAFFDEESTVVAIAVDPGVPPQPVNGQIADGARLRAQRAIAATDTDWGVGIEAGVVRQPGNLPPVVIQIAAVVDRDDRVTWGMSPGFELPNAIAARLQTGQTLGEAMASVYGDAFDVGQGAIAVLSGGRITRADLTRAAVEMAMVPRLVAREDKRL